MQLMNGAVFLNATALFFFFFFFALFGALTVIVPFATIYASLKSHKFDLTLKS